MEIGYLADVVVVGGQRRLRIDVRQIPFERLARELLSESQTLAHIARVDLIDAGDDAPEEELVLVGPHVYNASRVLGNDVHLAARKRVRRRQAEHVANVAARHEQQSAATHPNLHFHFIAQLNDQRC